MEQYYPTTFHLEYALYKCFSAFYTCTAPFLNFLISIQPFALTNVSTMASAIRQTIATAKARIIVDPLATLLPMIMVSW